MMTFNSTGPTIDPWDTLLATGLQLDFVLLINTFELSVKLLFTCELVPVTKDMI